MFCLFVCLFFFLLNSIHHLLLKSCRESPNRKLLVIIKMSAEATKLTAVLTLLIWNWIGIYRWQDETKLDVAFLFLDLLLICAPIDHFHCRATKQIWIKSHSVNEVKKMWYYWRQIFIEIFEQIYSAQYGAAILVY